MRIRIIAISFAVFGFTLLAASAFADPLFNSAPGMGWAQLLGMVIGALVLLFSVVLWRSGAGRASFVERPGVVSGAVIALVPLMVGSFVLTVFVASAAAREKGTDFEYDRTTGPARVRHLVSAVGARDVGICRCAPDETATLELPGGFRTVGSIYRGRGDGARPGMLLVHGNTWLGRRLSTYRVKARLLADAGYTVLAYDQVGFGEADDRFQHGRDSLPAAYDALAQAAAALEYLRSMDRVDPNDITALGHSGGVDAALQIAQAHPGVTRVVIMVAPPPPLPDEQSVRARGRYFQGRAERTYSFIHGRDWPEWFSWELTGRGGDEPDPFEPYREPGHPPLLLVLGENDEPRGHETVRARFDDVAGEKRMAFIPSSDHYLNTAQSLGLVFYHRQVARDFRDEVVTWLSEVES